MRFSVSIHDLDQFAEKFWEAAGDSRVFAFHGQMGAGKTTIITALCHNKGVKDPMASPTFSIINEYSFFENDQRRTIYHIDLYRLQDEEEVIRAGVEDCIDSENICMVEWPEKAAFLFDETTVHVFIQPISETERTIQIKLPGTEPVLKEQS